MHDNDLLNAFFDKALGAKFDVPFHLSDEKKCVVFVDKSGGFGDIEIYADDGELTVFFGRFTHSHFGCYRRGATQDDAYDEAASDVIDTLRKTFSGELLFFGNASAGGYEPADPSYESWFSDIERFAWPKSVR
ncbi:MAG: hypothetical protein KA144_11090 [Xanthomonadaceae bacterium]|nr:hypothetical protein [Xanthomonadaceae bacterium]